MNMQDDPLTIVEIEALNAVLKSLDAKLRQHPAIARKAIKSPDKVWDALSGKPVFSAGRETAFDGNRLPGPANIP